MAGSGWQLLVANQTYEALLFGGPKDGETFVLPEIRNYISVMVTHDVYEKYSSSSGMHGPNALTWQMRYFLDRERSNLDKTFEIDDNGTYTYYLCYYWEAP